MGWNSFCIETMENYIFIVDASIFWEGLEIDFLLQDLKWYCKSKKGLEKYLFRKRRVELPKPSKAPFWSSHAKQFSVGTRFNHDWSKLRVRFCVSYLSFIMVLERVIIIKCPEVMGSHNTEVKKLLFISFDLHFFCRTNP